MKRNIFLVALIVVAVVVAALFIVKKHRGKIVAVNQFFSHPALDSAREGMESVLKDHIKVRVQNAQGSISSATKIAQKQASKNPAFMVAIATPSAQADLKARISEEKTVLGFIAVTDPGTVGLTSARNVIGVVDSPPIEELITVIGNVFPDKKRIGIIFNPGEINSAKMAERVTTIAESRGFKVISSSINALSNIKLVTEQLVKQIDILYIPQDNMVVSALESIVEVTNENKIPVVGNDLMLVEKGQLLAVGCDYFKNGQLLGQMILDRLEKQSKSGIDIVESDIKDYKINEKAAGILGIDVNLLKRANE